MRKARSKALGGPRPREARGFDSPESSPGPPRWLFLALGLGLVWSRAAFVSRAPWDIDEAVFVGSVHRFDLADLSPQAPGFPVWVFLGRAIASLGIDPYRGFCLASAALSCAGAVGIWLWLSVRLGAWAGIGGGTLYAALPFSWFFSGRGFSDAPACGLILFAYGAIARLRESGRRDGGLALASLGLLLGMGLGIRPQLAVVFLPLLALEAAFEYRSHGPGMAFLPAVGATLAAALWSVGMAIASGGPSSIVSALLERAEYRRIHLRPENLGSLSDSFLVRAFVSTPFAVLIWTLFVLGLVVAFSERRIRLSAELVVLSATCWVSFWLLHSREMVRYVVPVAAAVSAGVTLAVSRLASHPSVALSFILGLAALSYTLVDDALRLVRSSPSPTAAALAALEELDGKTTTIVTDEVFRRFLRTESWAGRLRAPWVLEEDLRSGASSLPAGRHVARLTDFTIDPSGLPGNEAGWKLYMADGKALAALHGPRLLRVATLFPAPFALGPGVGPKEQARDVQPFRWFGERATLMAVQPGTAILLRGNRFAEGGETWVEAHDGLRTPVLRRSVPPGPFSLVLIPSRAAAGTVTSIEVRCDRAVALAPNPYSFRPARGCLVITNAIALPIASLWPHAADEGREADIGGADDDRLDLVGFHGPEREKGGSTSFRWIGAEASLVWAPVPGFSPGSLRVRWAPPAGAPSPVQVFVDGLPVGELTSQGSGFRTDILRLPPAAKVALAGTSPLRLAFQTSLRRADGDGRSLGAALDLIELQPDAR